MPMNYEAAVETTKDTFVSRIGAARGDTFDFVARVSRVADKLCGGIPGGEDGGQLKAIPSGFLGEAYDGASEILEAIQRGNAVLDRIERALP